MQFWQFNQSSLEDKIFLNDISSWRQLNLMRGVGGVLAWILSLMIWNDKPDEKQYKIFPL
jgi:hypothetical protein